MTKVRLRYVGKVTSKGQTTVPKEVRDFLGLEEGTQVEWTLDDSGKATVKARKLRAVDLAGIMGPPPNGRHVSIEEMNEAVKDAAVERFERAVRR
ncbi:MAG: AbrB/MazE/SpoVT family DNA-binding domain-containing protein [Devosia sp.]|nr:AbrB/MazE/SpoVT family DNA-binding domain-containing protein [Devosia sp.]